MIRYCASSAQMDAFPSIRLLGKPQTLKITLRVAARFYKNADKTPPIFCHFFKNQFSFQIKNQTMHRFLMPVFCTACYLFDFLISLFRYVSSSPKRSSGHA